MIKDKKVEQSVRKYAQGIVDAAYEIDPTVYLECEFEQALNTDETREAVICDVVSKFGRVTVFPNFKTGKTMAAMVKLGTVDYMVAEGFTPEQIAAEGKIFSGLLEDTPECIHALGYYLTHDLELYKGKI
jgi:hypothetical protein